MICSFEDEPEPDVVGFVVLGSFPFAATFPFEVFRLTSSVGNFFSDIEKHTIDSERVYETGQSMGGAGTFGAMFVRPNIFAAVIPVCGGWDPKDADKMKDIAIWIFHGDMDKVVPTDYSRNMVEAIKKAGGSPKYTEYEGVGHNSWSQTYASPETWEWLFQQKRTL